MLNENYIGNRFIKFSPYPTNFSDLKTQIAVIDNVFNRNTNVEHFHLTDNEIFHGMMNSMALSENHNLEDYHDNLLYHLR